MKSIIALALLLFAAASAVAAPTSPPPLVIHMAADGDDSRDGQGPERAVATLDRVHQILEEGPPGSDVVVRIAPGTYRGQRVIWTATDPDYAITFTRGGPDAENPVFDGCLDADEAPENCPGGTWFRLRHAGGEPSNLRFRHLTIRNYGTAISLDGDRNDENGFNSHNEIADCLFERIGNISNPRHRGSTATVRMVNSRHNRVVRSDFIDIINRGDRAALMHALYLAHRASDNVIADNRFIDQTGDAVRVRDRSHRNRVHGNRFDRAGIRGAMSEWYAYPGVGAARDMTSARECPSYHNEFFDNVIGTNYAGDPLQPIYVFHEHRDLPDGCEPPAADTPRMIARDNRTTAERRDP